jgi:hypothetical protein
MSNVSNIEKVSDLESAPRINPAFTAWFGAAVSNAANASVGGIPWWGYILIILMLYGLFYLLNKIYWVIETPGNIRARLRGFTDKYNFYGDQRSSRRGLLQYLNDLKRTGVPETHFALTNFYTCSANTAATFTPQRDGISSPEALRLALAAGARYLDLSIWNGGRSTGYHPFIAEMQPGSKWKRITMNELSFAAAMGGIQKYALAGPFAAADISEAPYRDDPLIIMLRFCGTPHQETFSAVAKALGDTIEPFRLDFTYYKGRGYDRLFKTPITEFMRKVIVITNMYPPESNPLNDYINLGPRGAIPLEMSSKEIIAIPDASKADFKAKIMQNLTITRDTMDEPSGDGNNVNWQAAHGLGIQYAAMNFWSLDDNLKSYRDMFGVNSFVIKPAEMRYIIEYAKPPLLPNPELNARDGKPRAPPGIILPGQ